MPNHKLKFKLVTPETTVYSGEVDSASIMTQMGEITVLPNHVPLIGILKAGEMRLMGGGTETFLAVTGGYVEVHGDNTITVLADAAERAEHIDEDRAQRAKDRAEKMLQEKDFANDIEFAALQAALERSLSRIKIARRRRR